MSVQRQVESKLLAGVEVFCAKHDEIAAVYLFGSYGTAETNRFSDVDLGLLFHAGAVPDLRREMELEAEFCAILQRDDLDLVILNKAPLHLCYRVIDEGQILVEKDYVVTSDFIEHTLRYFLDFDVDRRRFNADYDAALKEAYSESG